MKIVNYEKKHFSQLLPVLQKTWNFSKFFPEAESPRFVYELVLESVLSGPLNHTQIVENDEGKAVGCLVGTIKKNVTTTHKVKAVLDIGKLIVKTLYKILIGKFGPIGEVFERLKEIGSLIGNLERDKAKFDGVVELFILDESLRGKGLGKRMMNTFVSECKQEGAKSITLWTDRGCTFEFYDKYGFEMHRKIHSPILSFPECSENGFVYKFTIS